MISIQTGDDGCLALVVFSFEFVLFRGGDSKSLNETSLHKPACINSMFLSDKTQYGRHVFPG